MAGMYGEGIVLLSRVMSVLYLVLLNGSLLIFFVAFLLNLRDENELTSAHSTQIIRYGSASTLFKSGRQLRQIPANLSGWRD